MLFPSAENLNRMIRRITFCVILVIILINVECLQKDYRLPKTVKPLKYNITIEPIFNTFWNNSIFIGKVSIELIPIEDTNNITINIKDLHVNSTRILKKDDNEIKVNVTSSIIDSKKDFYIIHFNTTLNKGRVYELQVSFYGNLTFDKFGFFLANYTSTDGTQRVLAVTDFQPTGARKAFPCFDEPALKASFVVNIIRSKDFLSVSNENLNFTRYLENGRYQDAYNPTLNMSTYLVAFAVSDYSFTKIKEKIRVYAKAEAIENGKVDYILSISGKVMKILENITGIDYSLNKLDIFCIPSEHFTPGGMENWGLITTSERNSYCTNSTLTTTLRLQKCTTFMMHEMVHQWFGNLVTPSWWRYLWLSEGFSTYLEYYATSLLLPTWNLTEQFVIDVQQTSLRYDGNQIRKTLNDDPEKLGALPSSVISYYKGACIIRMVNHFLSDTIFNKGIKLYLQQNRFGTVEPSNLYHSFQQVLDNDGLQHLLNNLTVSEIMNTWDSSAGYPLVTLFRDYENKTLTILQNNFYPHNIFFSNHVWYIPLSIMDECKSAKNNLETTTDFWLTQEALDVNDFNCDGWVIINRMQTGYYRVNYDKTNWERISSFLFSKNFDLIPAINRAQLIDDAFNLAQLDYISYKIPLNLSKYLIRETNYLPLASFFSNIEIISNKLIFTSIYSKFQKYMVTILNTSYEYLGLKEKPNDSHLDKINRVNVATWMFRMRHEKYLISAQQLFEEWKSNNMSGLPANLEIPVFCGAMQLGNADDWHFLFQKQEKISDSEQKARMFISLGCSRNKTAINNFLDVLLSSNTKLSFNVRKTALEKLLQTGVDGIKSSIKYMISHIDNIQLTDRFLFKFIEMICEYFFTVDITELISKTPSTKANHPVISKCLLQTGKHDAWMSKGYFKDIEKWLLGHN